MNHATANDDPGNAQDWIESLISIRDQCTSNGIWPTKMAGGDASTHDILVALDAEMTDIDVDIGRIMEIGAAVMTADLVPQASLHIIVRVDFLQAPMSAWSTEYHNRSREYECGLSLVQLCTHSATTLEQADQEMSQFLKVFQQDSKQRMSLCGNSVWRDLLFINKYMPRTNALLHHRVVDCSGARELAKRACHVLNVRCKPPRPLDCHCAMYDVLDSINFMRWHARVITDGIHNMPDAFSSCSSSSSSSSAGSDNSSPRGGFKSAKQICADDCSPIVTVLPLHAHRRVGFDAINALRQEVHNNGCEPFILMPPDCECYVPEAIRKIISSAQANGYDNAQQVPVSEPAKDAPGDDQDESKCVVPPERECDDASTTSTMSWAERLKRQRKTSGLPSGHRKHTTSVRQRYHQQQQQHQHQHHGAVLPGFLRIPKTMATTSSTRMGVLVGASAAVSGSSIARRAAHAERSYNKQ